jgi:GIY-YIG catalytic domain
MRIRISPLAYLEYIDSFYKKKVKKLMIKNSKKVIRSSPSSIKHIKRYNNLLLNKSNIIKENPRKSGIYMITSNFNSKIYIGRSENLGFRSRDYLSENYLKKTIV